MFAASPQDVQRVLVKMIKKKKQLSTSLYRRLPPVDLPGSTKTGSSFRGDYQASSLPIENALTDLNAALRLLWR